MNTVTHRNDIQTSKAWYGTAAMPSDKVSEIQSQNIKSYIGGTVFALLIAALLCLFSGCAEQDLHDKQIASAAFFPSKPSYAAQSAYREDAREQLRLNQSLKAHAAGN